MALRSPLFDIFDPEGEIAERARLGFLDDEDIDPIGLVPIRRNRRPQLSDLMPEEEQRSMLNSLAAAGTSGLAGLGWILDTPGAVVRGGLSGGPMKALSALWETSADRVDGRELLRQYGMARDGDNWGNFAGGLATEMLLDPLTYFSFGLNQVLGQGAKTVAGKAVQKAGLLNDFGVYARNVLGKGEREALRESTARSLLNNIPEGAARESAMREFLGAGGTEAMLDAPLARMNRVSIPGFAEGATDLYGKRVGDLAAKAGDYLGEGLMTNPYTGRVARELQRAFDPSVMGFVDRQQQLDAQTIWAARKARERADRGSLAALQVDANQALRAAGLSLNDPELSAGIRNAMEADLLPGSIDQHFSFPENEAGTAARDAVDKLLGFAHSQRDVALQEAQKLGLPLNEYLSRTGGGWFPRQQLEFDNPLLPTYPAGTVPADKAQRPYSRGARPVAFDDNMGRGRDEAYDVMGQTDTLNRMSMDPELQEALRGADNKQARQILEEWWRRNGTPPRSSASPEEFWDGSPLMREAGFDDAPAGMSYMGNGEVRATKATGPSNDLYGWLDKTDEDGNLLYKAAPLPDDHPLTRQVQALQAQVDRAQASGEIDQILAPDGTVLRPGLKDLQKQLAALRKQVPAAAIDAHRDKLYGQLANLMRNVDPQHATTNIPLFGQNAFNELARYTLGRGRTETNAQEMLKLLQREAQRTPADQVVGGVNYKAADALKQLGLTGETAPDVLAKALGVENLDDISFSKKWIDDWSRVIDRGRTPPELSGLAQNFDAFTKRFKSLALLWPSRYTRDAYSGMFAGAMKGVFNPFDWWTGTRIGAGDYSGLLRKIKDLPRYKDLATDEAKVRQFLIEAAQQGLGTSTASDELLSGAGRANVRGMYPGAAAPDSDSLGDVAKRASFRDWINLFSLPTANGNRNPILEAGDRASQFTDAGNRFGSYLTAIRQGNSPTEAARLANLTQVDYRPEAFTDFERDVLKRVFPFYSYTKGITPLITDELVNSPAGLMGNSIRTLTRGSQPSENNFTPEYLRQSASVPVPEGLPFVGLPADSTLKRYLTNIDLPYESAINLITPGTGNSLLDQLGSGLRKTGMNILGQSNPLIKGPLEMLTNRQFYSGRQLSDLYSMLEQPLSDAGFGPLGRVAEQVLVNAPGGSRLLGTTRQVMDNRLSPQEKWSKVLVNALLGVKFQDVDSERTRRLAARDMLNQLLESTPGVRTYENVTVPDDVLRSMPEEHRRQYLLYKIIQSEASKRARERKKQQAALDPLQVLGVVNSY